MDRLSRLRIPVLQHSTPCTLQREQSNPLPSSTLLCQNVKTDIQYNTLCNSTMFRTFLSFLFLVSSATAFVTNANSMRTSTMQLQGMAFGEKVSILAGREFQLEEKEDREVEQTRIWLNPDGTVTLQDTDGPKFIAYEGRWSMVDEVNPFRMLLDRVYGGGMKARSSTDIGEFDYTVRREFVGDIQMIGSTVNVEGVVHLLDIENGQRDFEVGYFALIDSGFELEQ